MYKNGTCCYSCVESISYTIAKYLGLNTELTKAIATAHDIGHSPFGHQGERILSAISQRDLAKKFWHEKNGVDCVDKIEVLEDTHGDFQNLNLTYATRDIEDAITLGILDDHLEELHQIIVGGIVLYL